jgi:hypothetical protein
LLNQNDPQGWIFANDTLRSHLQRMRNNYYS